MQPPQQFVPALGNLLNLSYFNRIALYVAIHLDFVVHVLLGVYLAVQLIDLLIFFADEHGIRSALNAPFGAVTRCGIALAI